MRRRRRERPHLADHGGLVIWTAGTTAGGGEIELRMRKGDVIGAQDAITGTERTATVSASTITQTLELDAPDLLELAGRFPRILINVIQTQRERLFRASARSAALFSASVRSSSTRGEEIGVIAGPSLKGVRARLVAAARDRQPPTGHRARPLAVVRRRADRVGRARQRERHRADSERVRPRHASACCSTRSTASSRWSATPRRPAPWERVAAAAEGRRLEIVLVSDEAREASRMWYPGTLGSSCATARASPSSRSPTRTWRGSPAT